MRCPIHSLPRVVLGILLVVGLTGASSSCDPAVGLGVQWAPPVVEDFDAFDQSRWFVYHYPDSRPRRSRDLVDVADGVLRMRGTADASGVDVGAGVSDNHRRHRYGRWETRFRVSAGPGFGAAVLLWPENGRWPVDGEIDLIEVNSVDRQGAIQSIHNGPSNLSLTRHVVRDFTAWRTVAVDWLPSGVTYYMDGEVSWKVADPPYVPSTGPLHMTLQIDECAPEKYRGFIPCRRSTTPDVILEVDWVKVYEPAPGLVPS